VGCIYWPRRPSPALARWSAASRSASGDANSYAAYVACLPDSRKTGQCEFVRRPMALGRFLLTIGFLESSARIGKATARATRLPSALRGGSGDDVKAAFERLYALGVRFTQEPLEREAYGQWCSTIGAATSSKIANG